MPPCPGMPAAEPCGGLPLFHRERPPAGIVRRRSAPIGRGARQNSNGLPGASGGTRQGPGGWWASSLGRASASGVAYGVWPLGRGSSSGGPGPGRAVAGINLHAATHYFFVGGWRLAGAWLAGPAGPARAEVGIGVGLRGLRGLRQWAAPRLHRPRCRCVGPVGGLVGPAAELGVVCG